MRHSTNPVKRSTGTLLFSLVAALVMALASAGTAAAQAGQDTCAGLGATIGGSCTPLTNVVSGNNFNTALGYNALFSNTTGNNNTASGANALYNNVHGIDNTASGTSALGSNIDGNWNTASGVDALNFNISGGGNTATGMGALEYNTEGGDNTATGVDALIYNSASSNTADGAGALQENTTGIQNTAVGAGALVANTTGIDETASGAQALQSNTTGLYNTADGFQALNGNMTGSFDTATGVNALLNNITGQENTAVGNGAMIANTTGSNNIALGYHAGFSLTTGGNNVDIGNLGVAAESNTIRIGTQGTQTATFIAGIFNSAASGGAVEVNNTGKLGMVVSSARFKRDIRDMNTASSNLLKLRPVTFVYKQDPQGERQYGLIAEEVARVYPELAVYGTDGKVITIRYHELIPMLLNELQKQTRENAKQAEQIKRLSARLTEVKTSFEERLSNLERTIEAKSADGKLAAAR